jgi:homoserine/homoserine lactone efflux protein
MSFEFWLVFALTALALSLTPGPNALLCLDHGARFGARRAVWTALGSVLGMWAMVGICLAGLGAVMATSEMLFRAVKWAGGAYLIWLGIKLWRAPGFAGTGAPSLARPPSAHRGFLQGLMVMLSNPKTLLFFTTFLPVFMTPGAGFTHEFLLLGGTLAMVELAVELTLILAAARLAPWLARHGRIFNRITGGAFIGIGALVALAAKD